MSVGVDVFHPNAVYSAKRTPEIVEVPEMNFLMIDGLGDPNTAQAYKDGVAALYALSYGLKFALKKVEGLEYKVGPLEGLWWTDDMRLFSYERKSEWRWTMMIAQPMRLDAAWFETILKETKKKKPNPALNEVRLEKFAEGIAAQIMHMGPYSEEPPTIEKLHEFIAAEGYHFDGLVQKHHEIYLSDPNRTAPEKMKTIIRQPFVR